jgi:DNA polymerase-3 subunit delta
MTFRMDADSHILFLYGTDEYAIAKRVRECASVFANPSEAEMNMARLDARGMTDDQWANAVNSMPFLARQRLVILENPSSRFVQRKQKATDEDTPAASKGEEKPRDAAAEARRKFLESLEHIPPSTQVVMWEVLDARETGGRGGQNHWLAQWMQKKSYKVEFLAQPDVKSMTGWIVREAKAQGGEFAREAAESLAAQVGNDTRQAAQEVTKLLTYVDGMRPVSAADVQALTPRTAEAVIWDLVEALSSGDGHTAQSLLHRFLEDDGEFYVWSMIIRQFRMMLLAREVLDARGGVPEAMKALHWAEYPAKKAIDAARRFTMPRLEQIYHRLLDIDEAAKTGRMPLDVALDVLVVEMGR